jgi:hypothetical protein
MRPLHVRQRILFVTAVTETVFSVPHAEQRKVIDSLVVRCSVIAAPIQFDAILVMKALELMKGGLRLRMLFLRAVVLPERALVT